MLKIINRTICKRMCRKERGGTALSIAPPKKLFSLHGKHHKKKFTGEILCQLKETGIPLALDAKNMQANTEEELAWLS